MRPARKGDGTGLSFPGYSEVRTGDGDVLWSAGGDIPDSVVSRPDDNDTITGTSITFGVRIETSQQWSGIGARLSQNTDNATQAYLYRVSDGQLMGDSDISGLSSLDTFSISDANLSANEEYNFVIDAEGSDYSAGYFDSPSYPYTSSDGNLSIIDNAQDSQDTAGGVEVFNILEVGNVGLD